MGSVTRLVKGSLEEKEVAKNMPHKEKTGKLPPFFKCAVVAYFCF